MPNKNTNHNTTSNHIISATIIGAGPSSGCPIVKCFVNPEWEVEKTCTRCIDGIHNPLGPNNRNNPSFLIQIGSSSSSTSNEKDGVKNIIIDCGKTMRNSILKYFYPNNIRQIHQVIITHDHADAYLGMLEVAPLVPKNSAPIPLFSDHKTLKKINEVFPECFVSSSSSSASSSFSTLPLTYPIFTPQLVTAGQKFVIGGAVEVLPIYVLHGVNYFCLAFIFSLDESGKLFDGCETLVYISDTGDVTDKSRAEILKYKTKVLILDLLKMESSYISHFGHDLAIAEAKKIGAERTYFIGYSHSVDRDRCKKQWKEEEGDFANTFEFGEDSMRVF